MRSPEELITLFRANGLKATPQRHAVFAALYSEDSHPTAEAVWDRVRRHMPSISLRTVYQARGDLVSLGELGSVSVGHGAVRFDSNMAPHAHFVCRTCERIVDVIATDPDLLATCPGPAGADHPAGADGDAFAVDSAEVVFRGNCALCARG